MKKILCLFIFVFITVVSIDCVYANDTDITDYIREDGAVAVYMDKDKFNEFIEAPSLSFLGDINNCETVIIIQKTNNPDYMRLSYIENGVREDKGISDSFIYRLGYLSVFANDKFCDYVGEPRKMEQFLNENGIECNVKKSVAIYCRDLMDSRSVPLTVWVDTEGEDYLVTVDETPPDVSHRTEDTYKVYTYRDYCNRFAEKSGYLTIDGKVICDDVIIQNTTAFIPFRALVEGAGGRVEWDQKSGEAHFGYNDTDYVLSTRDYPHYVAQKYVEQLKKDKYDAPYFYPGNTSAYCKNENGTVMIEYSMAEEIAEDMGFNLSIDYEKSVIVIDKSHGK